MGGLNRTRLSLFYLLAYLMLIGAGLLFLPQATLALLQSSGDYGDVFPRVAGMLMIGIGIAVAGMIALRTDALYPGTLAIRLFFCACLLWFYLRSGDPLFVVLLVIVGIGLTFTALSFLTDRRSR